MEAEKPSLKRAPTLSAERAQDEAEKPNTTFPSPLQMTILFAIGIAGAVAHQVYYRRLDRKAVTEVSVSQTWNLRIGSVLAFLVKTSWTMAILVAHTQQVWMTMDRKFLSLNTVDAMFGAVTDFKRFSHWQMLRRAKVATLLAVVSWCLPLSAIVTPSTLTVEAVSHVQNKTIEAPMVNFDIASNFATYTPCNAYDCQVNTENYDDPAVLFQGPNAQTIITSVATSSTGRVQEMPPPYPNATYSLSFSAPYTKCGAANQSTVDAISKIESPSVPVGNTDTRAGIPAVSYHAFVPAVAFRGGLVEADMSSLPTTPGLIGYASIPVAPELWIKVGVQGREKYYVCTSHNATYTTTFTFTGGAQTTKTDISVHDPIAWVVALSARDPSLASMAYQAIWLSFVQQLVGRFDNTSSSSPLFQTPVIGSQDLRPYFTGSSVQPFATDKTIPEIIEELSKNLTLSFFASGVHRSVKPAKTLAMITTSTMTYQYNQTALLVSYCITLLVTATSIVVGLHAYRRNGGEHGLAYSAIVQAARDSEKEASGSGDSPAISDVEKSCREPVVQETLIPSQ